MNTTATTADTAPGAAQAVVDPKAPLIDQPVLIEKTYEVAPEQVADDLRALDNLMQSQAPRSAGAYSIPDGLHALAAVDMAPWRAIAHNEKFAPSEFAQFATALSIAARDSERGYTVSDRGYQSKTVEQLRRAWGDGYDKQIGFARSEAKMLMEKYPQVRELLEGTIAGNSEFVIRILANRGERRANRGE